jgi:SAM-dependent methyltransferase
MAQEETLCFRTARFGLVRCRSCGCYRIDPAPIREDQDGPAFYTTYYSQKHDGRFIATAKFVRASRFWRVVEQVPSLGEADRCVADLGCGEGHLCGELKAANWPVVIGVDIAKSRIARARELYPEASFFDRPLCETDIPTHSLDLIIMDNVIEHLPNPVGMVEQLRCYLRARGRLVLITPNMESGNFRLLGRRWTPELSPHTHIYLFTSSSLHRLLSNAGFKIEASGSFHLPLYSLPEWLGLYRSGETKEAAWRAMQEMGSIYSRLIGAGPMLYSVAHLPY